MLVTVKLNVKCIAIQGEDFIGLFDFEWRCQNKVGNVDIIVL